jgi:putative transcriptional regulator
MKKSILETVHESAKGLFDAKLLDAKTMRSFDKLCLPLVKNLKPKEIKRIRLREKVSQSVFAEYLNASPSTIEKWETGEKHPGGIALKILNVIAEKGLSILT